MTEIKLGRIPHTAFPIPHLNGSFPVFIFGLDGWGKSGRGLPQSKTWRMFGAAR